MDTRREELQRLTVIELESIVKKLCEIPLQWKGKNELILSIISFDVEEEYEFMAKFILRNIEIEELFIMSKSELIQILINLSTLHIMIDFDKEEIIEEILELEIEYGDEGFCE